MSTFELQKNLVLELDLPLFLLWVILWCFLVYSDLSRICWASICYFIFLGTVYLIWSIFLSTYIHFLRSFHRGFMLLIWETVGLWLSVMVAPYSSLQCSNMISISPISWNVVAIVIYLVLVRYWLLSFLECYSFICTSPLCNFKCIQKDMMVFLYITFQLIKSRNFLFTVNLL